jgi:hypothetical protein
MQSTGEAERTGDSEILVQRESAVQRGSRSPQDVFHINKDHSNMVKFERDDINYFVVRSFLKDAVDNKQGGNDPQSPERKACELSLLQQRLVSKYV